VCHEEVSSAAEAATVGVLVENIDRRAGQRAEDVSRDRRFCRRLESRLNQGGYWPNIQPCLTARPQSPPALGRRFQIRQLDEVEYTPSHALEKLIGHLHCDPANAFERVVQVGLRHAQSPRESAFRNGACLQHPSQTHQKQFAKIKKVHSFTYFTAKLWNAGAAIKDNSIPKTSHRMCEQYQVLFSMSCGWV
jgi:hypothetical protein